MLKESTVQNNILLESANQHIQLYRNNVGACVDQTGRQIRYGLANDSAALNKVIKSSDLIGVTPYMIAPSDIGRVVGLFTAVECKAEGWVYRDTDERARAQARFHGLVREMGGLAGFASSELEFLRIIGRSQR